MDIILKILAVLFLNAIATVITYIIIMNYQSYLLFGILVTIHGIFLYWTTDKILMS